MSRIFIDRPIFAWVIAIIIMLIGVMAIVSLPVAQYPDVAPTQVNIRANYPGASAATLESSSVEREYGAVCSSVRVAKGSRSRPDACRSRGEEKPARCPYSAVSGARGLPKARARWVPAISGSPLR